MQLTWARGAALGTAWTLALIAILLFRASHAGDRAMAESDVHFDRGAVERSLISARQAFGWYFPFAPHVERAEQRLVSIAIGAEATGDSKMALLAWGAIRGVLHETRHPWSGHDALVDQADFALARLLPRAVGVLTEPASDEQLRAQYQRRETPQPVFYAATSFGAALLAIAAGLLLTRRELRHLTFGVALGSVGLFLWVFAASGA
jgi:hypothetical protein